MKNEIHIWDLPVEKVYVKLRSEFREQFFEAAHQKFRTWDRLAKFIVIKRGDTLLARNWKRGMCCCPLSVIFKISDNLNMPKYKIEKNITEIRYKTKKDGRGGNSGKPIIIPKLPIKINKDFIEILGHICGDGSIVRKNIKKGISLKYVNSEPELIRDFQDKIKKVFGDINANIQVRDGPLYRKKNYLLQYPTIVSLFILSVFDCKSGDEKDIPDILFELSEEERCSFLRALFDDEGTVSVKYKDITIGLKPRNQIDNVRKLLIGMGFSPSKTFFSGGITKIKICRSKDILLFKSIIGFKHPQKKERLDLIIENGWKFDRYPEGEVKEKIISLLKEREHLGAIEIASFLKRNISTTRTHLSKLEKESIVLFNTKEKNKEWRLV